ncbi:hypothetical protein [Flavobacterium poyangense]|uniref:hypothetical protein n=1 Tax=Flavobacterium poyangense TaxID=2204302 RepID=UPI001AB05B02|nr:hypothetical protein [Flavobacterium sp. JXAS1]
MAKLADNDSSKKWAVINCGILEDQLTGSISKFLMATIWKLIVCVFTFSEMLNFYN